MLVYATRKTSDGDTIALVVDPLGVCGIWSMRNECFLTRFGTGDEHAGFALAMLDWNGEITLTGESWLAERRANADRRAAGRNLAGAS